VVDRLVEVLLDVLVVVTTALVEVLLDVLVDVVDRLVEVLLDVLVVVTTALVEVVLDVLVEVVLLLVLVEELVVVALVLVLDEVLTGPLVLVELLLEVVVVGRLEEVEELELVEVVVTGAVELVVVATVLVVVGGGGVVVVVLPAGTQPPCSHASQQLGNSPTQALPPRGGLQDPARRLMLHVVLPLASVRQQVTAPALPQVDWSAQPTTTPAHSSRREPSATAWSVTSATQLT